jgi:transglutaminase-like putative cysteine protease
MLHRDKVMVLALLLSASAAMLTEAACAPGSTGKAQMSPPLPDPLAAPDPDLSSTAERSSPVAYDVGFDVVFTPPYHAEHVRVWLPVPQSDAGQEVSGYATDPAPAALDQEPLYGNRLAFFSYERPVGAQIVRQSYKVRTWELRWNLDPARVSGVQRWPVGFERFLRSEPGVVVDDRIRTLTQDIVGAETNPALQARRILDYVLENLRYDHSACSLQASAEWALSKKTGHCSDYHGLTASLARAAGIPSRVAYGINPLPKASPSHCKNEMYFHPYGWVSFDVSETQKLLKRIEGDPALDETERAQRRRQARDRLYAGFRDNTWVRLTVGTAYPLAPGASRTPPLVRTAYIEADGEPLPDPDPGNPVKREFAWMTLARYASDRPVTYPF